MSTSDHPSVKRCHKAIPPTIGYLKAQSKALVGCGKPGKAQVKGETNSEVPTLISGSLQYCLQHS